MSSLVFLLEEESAKNMLQGILSRLLPHTPVHYICFEGKQDLERQMVRKIRWWRDPDSRFIILRDKDAGDCMAIKQKLIELTRKSGKPEACLVRIACHELENFFLGDLAAVGKAMDMPALAKKQGKAPYRTPDNIANAAEQLKKITDKKYYKLSGARAIAPFMQLDGSNQSHSFKVLCSGIRNQAEKITASRCTQDED